MKVTFINNKETADVDISKCTTIADIIQAIADSKGYDTDSISLVMKGRQLKPSETISKSGVTETSKVIGVLRNKKPVSAPAPQPRASTPIPQPPVSMAPPVPLPQMEPLVMKNQPSPKPEARKEAKATPSPALDTDEEYAKSILSSEMFIPLLYNCSMLPRNCEQLLDLIREKDNRLFNYIVKNPNVLTDAIVEVSKLPPERVRQAFNRERETLPQEDSVIHLTAEDMKAIEALMQLGFSQEDATVAYLSCDKNVELAASYLYGN